MVEPASSRSGLVVALQANYCWVSLDTEGPGGVDRLLCTRRARLDRSGLSVCVGDRVVVDGIDWPQRRAAVALRDPRRNVLERPAVANIDRVVVVMALAEPAPDPLLFTRFLLTAEATGQPVIPVLSKADLVPQQEVVAWRQRLALWGYDAMPLRLGPDGVDHAGLERLRERLSSAGITVVCGPSGVGKSSLLNALLPDQDLRVGAVSGRLRRGRHTTRHVELFPLVGGGTQPDGALVADTPGFNRPDLTLPAADLAGLFPEIRARLDGCCCRYSNCAHLDDPGCVVGSGWDRHPHYRQLFLELRERGERPLSRQSSAQQQASRRRGRQQDAAAQA
ncbi:MAG: ribosome small subunit-dependent GTPase A [Synechococcus sp. ELA057]